MAKSIDPDLGFNTGHDIGSGDWSITRYGAYLDDLEYNHGSKLVRYNHLAYSNVTNNTALYTKMKQCIELALSRSFNQIVGITANGEAALTAANHTGAFQTAQTTLGTYLQTLTVPAGVMLAMGTNEEEDNLHASYSKADFRTNTRTTVAAAVKAVYNKGPYLYCTYHSEIGAWITEITANGWGSLDQFWGNIYRNNHHYFESVDYDTLSQMAAAFSGVDSFGNRRWGIGEFHSLDHGLYEAVNNGDESRMLYHIAQKYAVMKDRFPKIKKCIFGYDVSSQAPTDDWSYKNMNPAVSGTNNGFRNYRKLLTEQGNIMVHTNPKWRNRQQLIGNNAFYNDTNNWAGENGATISTSGLSTEGPDGKRCARVTSTTHGVSRVYSSKLTNAGGIQNFNMLIPPHLVGVPIYLGWKYKRHPDQVTFPAPNGNGKGSMTIDPSTGSLSLFQVDFTPTDIWQQEYRIFRASQAGYLILNFWGKQAFSGSLGTILIAHLHMEPLFNENVPLPLDFIDIHSPFTVTQAEASGGGNYTDTIMWMPPAHQLRV